MKDAITRLIDVKTIVTLLITAAFIFLAVTGRLTVEQFMIVAIMVYTYFFTKTKDNTVTTSTTLPNTPEDLK